MKKKIFSLLVLLVAAVSGAWAQQKYNVTFSGFDNASCNTTFTDVTLPYSKSFVKTDACSNAYDIDVSSNNEQLVETSFGGVNFTITVNSAFEGTVTVDVGGMTESFDPYSRNITVACVPAAPPFDYTFSVADCDHGSGTIKFFIDGEEVKGAYQADEGKTVTMTITPDEGWIVDATSVKAESYSTWEAAGAPSRRAPGNIQILGDVTLTKSTTAENTWTFLLPAANVLVSAAYIPVAAFAPAEPSGTLAPTAAEGVIAGEDKAIIVAGTVANIPETTNPQGTVKYFVTDNKDMTAEQAAKANGWMETLPTAAGYTGSYADDFQVYVWYYIQAATGYADSKPQRIEVTVQSNLFDLTLKAANANTIDATQASKGTVTVKVGTGTAVDKTEDITNGKLEAIKMGSEVKLNTKPGYKFRKVEAKKKEKTYTITPRNQRVAYDYGNLTNEATLPYNTTTSELMKKVGLSSVNNSYNIQSVSLTSGSNVTLGTPTGTPGERGYEVPLTITGEGEFVLTVGRTNNNNDAIIKVFVRANSDN